MKKRSVLITLLVLMMVSMLAVPMASAAYPSDYRINVHPYSCPNGINAESKGTMPVAIFGGYVGDEFLDVTTIVPASIQLDGVGLALKGNGKLFCNLGDIDGDGYVDLLCKFSIPELNDAGAFEDTDFTLTCDQGTWEDNYNNWIH